MRALEYSIYFAATLLVGWFSIRVFVGNRWSDRKKGLFSLIVTVTLFVGFGVYRLTTGKDASEQIQQLIFCNIYRFSYCPVDHTRENEQYAVAIMVVLQLDAAFQKQYLEAAHRALDDLDPVKAVKDETDAWGKLREERKSIDLSACPPSFKDVFGRYIDAEYDGMIATKEWFAQLIKLNDQSMPPRTPQPKAVIDMDHAHAELDRVARYYGIVRQKKAE